MDKLKKGRILKVLSLITLLLLAVAAFATEVQAQETCLQCHGDVGQNVEGSVHSFLSCTSCHTDITGFPHPEGASLDKKESVVTCSYCHKGQITESYRESFHGKAVHLGSQRSATCADCHGAHDVLGADNPNSKVAKANIPQTCATCHDKPSPGFAEGSQHFKLAPTGPGAPMYYTAKFFIWLTLITITALVIHIELQLYHNLRTILRERKRG
ncbi:cytochrome c3 family protein [Desulfosporosinus sp.]|uniref:cytochrome c3 family protein n=1 Tax=Desulfosporosinus sp. TaxID=157907 RepID=UPI000E875C21|nr:cytochrome c3 family protein [Desulfosporosinus sp.]MBC2721898.1 molecular chaperone DnaJ [Desulfosporosinus sp.]MBC2727173.1 molecular chaperone DnaJ [Desulfosporosinus sp.]HBV88217.1 molecular chaperone DnaJ [Desulfosporosinus sp.]